MSRALFTEEEVRLATERRVKYIGAAKVSINQIQFDTPLPRDLDPKNLDRLRNIFRKNRCRRLDLNNHVPVIVSQQDLTVALRKANVTHQSLLTNDAHKLPRLVFTIGQLQGLHGRHRLQVGAEVLPPADRWWTVDLYMNDLGEELRTSLVEEYANQKMPTDGEIYRKIRQYEGDYDEAFRERWLVRLSRSNQDKLNQLDNRRNRYIRRAFDRLLNIPGLWPGGMRISVIHRLIASSCVEEIISYLGYIWDFWSSLVSSDRTSMKKIDQDTVERLQLLAPGKCHNDAKTACGLVLSGQAFAEFNEEERKVIWTRMQSFSGLIPSLYTFFEDFKYLESCAHCLKRLFGPSSSSIRETMSSMFIPCLEEGLLGSRAADCIIQTSESTFRRQPATDMERLDTAYLQMWLYAMRHYHLMPPDPKRDCDLLAKAARAKPDQRAIYEMAELARQLGFRSKEIDMILDSSPDHQIARSALLQARKSSRYRYNDQQFDLLVSRIVSCFAEAIPCQPDLPQELLADSAMSLQVRSGAPQIRTHEQDSPLLFLDRMNTDFAAADTITSFYVRCCVYFAFFGKSPQYATENTDQAREAGEGQRMADTPQSPLFVQENAPIDVDASNFRTTSMIEPLSGSGSGILHQDVSEQSSLSALRNEPASTEPAITPTHSILVSSELEGEEAMSDCTMVSFEEISLESSPAASEVMGGTNRQDDLTDQSPINLTAHSPSAEPNANELSAPGEYGSTLGLNVLIGDLRRAQHEEQQLEEQSESEWVDDDVEPSSETEVHQGQPDESASPVNNQIQSQLQRPPDTESNDEWTESMHTDVDSAATLEDVQSASIFNASPEPSENSDPPSSAGKSPISPLTEQDHVASLSKQEQHRVSPETREITFWYFERGGWKRSDRILVNPDDTSAVERLADKYLRKKYSLYDYNLQGVRPAQCYQAATDEGRNAIFIISEYEERNFINTGRVVQDRQLVTLAAQALDRVDASLSSERLFKRMKS